MSTEDLTPITGIDPLIEARAAREAQAAEAAQASREALRRLNESEQNRIADSRRQAADAADARRLSRDGDAAATQQAEQRQTVENRIVQERLAAERLRADLAEERRLEQEALTNRAAQLIEQERSGENGAIAGQTLADEESAAATQTAPQIGAEDQAEAGPARDAELARDEVERNRLVQERQAVDDEIRADRNEQLNNSGVPRTDLSPLQNEARFDQAEQAREAGEEPEVRPPYGAALVDNNTSDYVNVDNRLLERDFFDNPGGNAGEGNATIMAELYALRASLQREIDRLDRILGERL